MAPHADSQQPSEAEAWEIQSMATASQGGGWFYVVKHNRITGETLVLSCKGGCNDEKWYELPIVRSE